VRLSTDRPFDGDAVLTFLAARAIDGVEEVVDGAYRRTLALPGGDATIALTPRADGVELDGPPEAAPVARALFGLDQDPAAILGTLGDDPVLGPLVRARPGLRVPGAVSGWELAVRAVVGQQVSVAAARRLLGRLAEHAGGRFPTPAALLAAPDDAFRMPRTRIRTLRELAAADPPLETPADARALTALYGIGPWTAGYVALRLGDPDVFLDGDVAVRTSLARLGATTADAPRWAPHRSHAVLHLWVNLANPPHDA
jgi:AraC family transcriptional regulator of adaptative response / DNA-3-methyladenine glycosylase II